MKKAIIILLFLLPFLGFSNNLKLLNIHLSQIDTVNKTVFISFDCQWENSWRIDTGAANWDAIWVFGKFRVNNGDWQHIVLENSGFVPGSNATINVPSDGMGAFLYNSNPSAGILDNYSSIGSSLLWDYGLQGVDNGDDLEIRLFGIEMVYVPEGAYYLGTGFHEGNNFYQYPDPTQPFHITSEAAISVDSVNGALNYIPDTQFSGDNAGPIPAAFPKGFAAFYCMKYEATQGQYAAYINTLTPAQQSTRLETGTGIKRYNVKNINGLVGVDYNGNNVFGDADDGEDIALNRVNWEDMLAYADWSGLRPMTELEFEKACRGPELATSEEFAWGNDVYICPKQILNPGLPTEKPDTGNSNMKHTGGPHAPMRVGCFANDTTTREESGASYWGIMELSGNQSEFAVPIGSPEGRSYDGVHGDGILSTNGLPNQLNWPTNTAGARGGESQSYPTRARTSVREYATCVLPYTGICFNRSSRDGYRCVRTAP